MSEYVAVWSLQRGRIDLEPLDAGGQRMVRQSERADRAEHARPCKVQFLGNHVVWARGWQPKPPVEVTALEARARVRRMMELAGKARCA